MIFSKSPVLLLSLCFLSVKESCQFSMQSSTPFSVKSSTLDQGLTDEERTIVSVFRSCGPSVAFVTSFAGDTRRRNNKRSKSRKNNNSPPTSGTSLGSGSGFVLESDGYLVTNYHVIQRAYQLNESMERLNNVTKSVLPLLNIPDMNKAKVFVRINSSSKYLPADIVGVKPEVDVAVLKVASNETYPSLQTGSSSDLLVGQKVVAIGNPFGLDQSVSAGVVSALNRKVTGVAGNDIPNCIQTDAAINPGNSGGPLLNSRGQLVGVNTAIITTSGSNAGIGFAIPVDAMKRATDEIIERHRRQSNIKSRGYLGMTLASDVLCESVWKNATLGALVTFVQKDSPAEKAGLKPLQLEKGCVEKKGDVIVAINGREVQNGVAEVEQDVRTRRVGEQMSLTVEDGDTNERRLVYLTLS